MLRALVDGVNLGKRGLKIRQTKVSPNSQLQSEHQAIYAVYSDEAPKKCTVTKMNSMWQKYVFS